MKKLKVLAVLLTLVMFTNVHAALQSRPGVAAKTKIDADDFFKLAREMEAEGGALGLNAVFDEKGLTETSPSNNIDMHMCKNTEWGTVAMLSASDYGAGNGKVTGTYNSSTKIYNTSSSTTGNITGVFGMKGGLASYEYTSGGIVERMSYWYSNNLKNAPVRYVDSYEEGHSTDFNRYIPGDATYEVIAFNSDKGTFVGSDRFFLGYTSVFVRGKTNIFNADSNNGYWGGNYNNGELDLMSGSRGVVWVGEGL